MNQEIYRGVPIFSRGSHVDVPRLKGVFPSIVLARRAIDMALKPADTVYQRTAQEAARRAASLWNTAQGRGPDAKFARDECRRIGIDTQRPLLEQIDVS